MKKVDFNHNKPVLRDLRHIKFMQATYTSIQSVSYRQQVWKFIWAQAILSSSSSNGGSTTSSNTWPRICIRRNDVIQTFAWGLLTVKVTILWGWAKIEWITWFPLKWTMTPTNFSHWQVRNQIQILFTCLQFWGNSINLRRLWKVTKFKRKYSPHLGLFRCCGASSWNRREAGMMEKLLPAQHLDWDPAPLNERSFGCDWDI